ncbi:hypothetical protein N9H59_03310 [Flavobacteriaceae bacterium]|nr:hypothetical protein [Flavobacteriaceae bacterium]
MKDRLALILVLGILILLILIVVGDFVVSLKESRPVDESVIHLLQITITGLIGIVGTYIGMKNKDN